MTTTTTTTPRRRRTTLADIYHERTHFDFVGRAWRWGLLSGTLIVISLFALGFRGLNLGIEFTGGTSWQVAVSGKSPDVAAVRAVVESEGIDDAQVTIIGDNQVRVEARVEGSDSKDEQTKAKANEVKQDVQDALAKYANARSPDVSVSDVGGSWGSEVSTAAIQALIAFLVIVIVYLSVRFEFKMAVAAIIAVFHDIIITAGAYALTQWDVTPGTVIAFLTILGFSLYDTVVVFDKVRENGAKLGTQKTDNYSDMVNRSMNEVLMRSLNTSILALLPVVSLLVVGVGFYGADALKDFSLALFCGLLVGAYSSIFVAVPILATWKEREPKFRAMRERSAIARQRAASAGPPPPDPESDATGAVTTDGEGVESGSPAGRVADPPTDPGTVDPSPRTVTPRPRKKKGRR